MDTLSLNSTHLTHNFSHTSTCASTPHLCSSHLAHFVIGRQHFKIYDNMQQYRWREAEEYVACETSYVRR